MSAASRPALVALGGLVASGKSTLSQCLVRSLDAVRVEADAERDELMREAEAEGGEEEVLRRAADPDLKRTIYQEVLRDADAALASGRAVVVEGSFASPGWRGAARELAALHGAPFVFVECRVDADVRAHRLRERARARGESEDAWRHIAETVGARWREPAELPPEERLVLDTTRPPEENAARVAERLAAAARRNTFAPDAALDAVTFDCWNTLLYERHPEQAYGRRLEALELCVGERGLAPPPETVRAALDDAWRWHMALWEAGVASGPLEIAARALETLGIADAAAGARLGELFAEASLEGEVAALEGAHATLERLAAHGIRRGLICDTGFTPGRVVRRLLERHGMLELLEVTVFSDEAGVPKPHVRVFRSALMSLGVGAKRSLHVGDLLRTDVAGARAAGMRSVRIRHLHDDPTPLPDADAVVDSYSELRSLLGLD